MDNKYNLDFDKAFTLYFDLKTGKSDLEFTHRQLSGMEGMYADQAAYNTLVAQVDPLVYEFFECGAPAHAGDLAFGTSITYAGKVGNEYFMTKGHFHTIIDTAEVYYCLSGQGYMLMESPEGEWQAEELYPGKAVYVPKRFAHRSINTHPTQPLTTFFVFRGDAGHDYGTIETKGFRKLIIEKDGKPAIIDNPNWV